MTNTILADSDKIIALCDAITAKAFSEESYMEDLKAFCEMLPQYITCLACLVTTFTTIGHFRFTVDSSMLSFTTQIT